MRLGQVRALSRLAAMPAKKRLAVLIAIAAIAAAVAGCGSDEIKGTLTADQAAELNADLEAVQQAADANDCLTAGSKVRQFRARVFELPSGAGADLKTALQDSGKQLSTLVADQCGTASGVTGTTGAQPTGSSDHTTTTDTTSTASTASTSSTPTTVPNQQSPPPPGSGNGNGLGNGNGQGNGNPGAGNPGGGSTGGGSTGGTGGTGVGGG